MESEHTGSEEPFPEVPEVLGESEEEREKKERREKRKKKKKREREKQKDLVAPPPSDSRTFKRFVVPVLLSFIVWLGISGDTWLPLLEAQAMPNVFFNAIFTLRDF